MYKRQHEGIDLCVVGGGSQNQLAIAESVGNSLGHIASGEIIDNNFRTSLVTELLRQELNGFFGISVNGGVGDRCV